MASRALLSRISSVDWDFAGSFSDSPFSPIHFHPCRFASQLPATLIGLLTEVGDLVVDPFVGSGTTLVEAQRLGRRSLGVDINPIAVLVSQAKTIDSRASTISEYIQEIKHGASGQISRQMSVLHKRIRPNIPDTVQAEKWYTKRVREDLGLLWAMANKLEGASKIVALAAFSAILLPVCRETRHWGYVCDNTTPKDSREGDALAEYLKVLNRLEQAYLDRDAEIKAATPKTLSIPEARIICGDTVKALRDLTTNSVDCVITSPPYFGVSDYVKSQRLSMEWFGYEIEPLRLGEIGARSKRHRRTASTEYLNSLTQVFEQIRRSLKRGAFAAIILGQSGKRDEVLQPLRTIFNAVGLKTELELNRTLPTQRRMSPSITGEHLFILSK